MPEHRRGCVCPKCSRLSTTKPEGPVQTDAFSATPVRPPPPDYLVAMYRAARNRSGRDERLKRLLELRKQGVPLAAAFDQIELEWRNR